MIWREDDIVLPCLNVRGFRSLVRRCCLEHVWIDFGSIWWNLIHEPSHVSYACLYFVFTLAVMGGGRVRKYITISSSLTDEYHLTVRRRENLQAHESAQNISFQLFENDLDLPSLNDVTRSGRSKPTMIPGWLVLAQKIVRSQYSCCSNMGLWHIVMPEVYWKSLGANIRYLLASSWSFRFHFLALENATPFLPFCDDLRALCQTLLSWWTLSGCSLLTRSWQTSR